MSNLNKRKLADSFLEACKILGFQEIKNPQNLVPYTIYRESHSRFTLTVFCGNGEVVPIPVCIFSGMEKRRIRIIEKLVRSGKFVIFHPLCMFDASVPAFAQVGKYRIRGALTRMLSGAGDGSKVKIKLFAKVLNKKCEEFLGQELLGFPQLPLSEECSDDGRDHHGACGPAAEENFLKAMLNLGFSLVSVGDKMHPMSIRLTTDKEDAALEDFIIRVPGYRYGGQFKKCMPIIPLQITLMWFPKNKNLKRKLEAEKRGDIVLIWADESFGVDSERHTNLFGLLKNAADGQEEALKALMAILKERFSRFYSKNSRVSEEEVQRSLSLIQY